MSAKPNLGTVNVVLSDDDQAAMADQVSKLRKLAALLIKDRDNLINRYQTSAADLNEAARLRALLDL